MSRYCTTPYFRSEKESLAYSSEAIVQEDKVKSVEISNKSSTSSGNIKFFIVNYSPFVVIIHVDLTPFLSA